MIYLDKHDKHLILRTLQSARDRLKYSLDDRYRDWQSDKLDHLGIVWLNAGKADYNNLCTLIDKVKKEPASDEPSDQLNLFDIAQ